MNRIKLMTWGLFVLALLAVFSLARPAAPVRGFDLEGFAGLPVLEGGRVKPLDSVARNALLVIRGKQDFAFEGRKVGAREWLLDVLHRPDVAERQPIFVIDDPEVLGLLGRTVSANRYHAFQDLVPALEEIQKQANAAQHVPAAQRTRFQAAVVNLFDRMYLFHRLRCSLQLPDGGGLGWEQQQAAMGRWQVMRELAYFRPFVPLRGQPTEAWLNAGEALAAGGHPALAGFDALGEAYRRGDGPGFQAALASLQQVAREHRPEVTLSLQKEQVFNRMQPFNAGMALYVGAFLLLCLSWLVRPQVFQSAASALLWAGFVVHTLGLLVRMLLQGRPPVTNLYSSAVFVGWGAAALGLVAERFHRRGFGTLAAAVAGFGSLLVAHHLSDQGDTMEMMRAVLDSNFWLATHVITITIGYSGTFLAGGLAIFYAVRRHLVAEDDPATNRTLVDLVYGIQAFSLFFSFVGTVLGGIWADQSWGRFWGWDPKENGALLIVLWIAILLHGRLTGTFRERGLMAMSIGGNIVTSLSWFGVNLLGVGLHSYGFMEEGFLWLMGFILSQLVLIAVCLAPRRFRSTA